MNDTEQPLATRMLRLGDRDILLSGDPGDRYFEDCTVEGEADFVEFIRRMLPEGGTFLDIGANIGVTSLIASKLVPDCKIIAIEAAPSIARITRHNFQQNGVADFELHNVAAGAGEGTVRFSEYMAFGHIILGDDVGSPSPPISVPMRSVDSIVDGRHIDVVKIDVEGFEESVLQGCDRLEQNSRPAYFIEFNAWTLSAFGRVNPMDFMQRLLERFAFISYMNEHGVWVKVDSLSCIHVVFRGFNSKIDNLICSNDPSKVIL